MRRCVRLFHCLPVVVVALAGCGKGGTKVTGEGATFVEPVMKSWADEYKEKTGKTVAVDYKGSGSGAGVSAMTKKLAQFGCSDAPMTAELTKEADGQGGAVIHVPLVIGAVVPVYNLPGLDKPLVFDGPLLAGLFTGQIKKWNDPAVAKLNPGVTLPDLAAQPVYRADTSGTSFIFTDYLAKVSPAFKTTVGASTKPTWPNGVGTAQSKSDGVAGYVSRTEGAVGYVELTFALGASLKFGSVVNKAGKPVAATLESITAAASATAAAKAPAEPPYSLHELTYNLTDAPGEASYPIAGMSFAVLYKTQPAANKPAVEFLKWATSAEGQTVAAKTNYAPLPPDLQAAVQARLGQVEFQP